VLGAVVDIERKHPPRVSEEPRHFRVHQRQHVHRAIQPLGDGDVVDDVLPGRIRPRAVLEEVIARGGGDEVGDARRGEEEPRDQPGRGVRLRYRGTSLIRNRPSLRVQGAGFRV